MAAVRQTFLDEVAASPSRRKLSELTKSDQEALGSLLRSWLGGVVLGRRMRECKLRLFLTSGRLFNQAEVGSQNPERPPELERAVWMIDTDDLADLPIYGYVASIGDVRDPNGGPLTRKTLHDTYGAARLIYKPELQSRSTITVGTASGCFTSGGRRQARSALPVGCRFQPTRTTSANGRTPTTASRPTSSSARRWAASTSRTSRTSSSTPSQNRELRRR